MLVPSRDYTTINTLQCWWRKGTAAMHSSIYFAARNGWNRQLRTSELMPSRPGTSSSCHPAQPTKCRQRSRPAGIDTRQRRRRAAFKNSRASLGLGLGLGIGFLCAQRIRIVESFAVQVRSGWGPCLGGGRRRAVLLRPRSTAVSSTATDPGSSERVLTKEINGRNKRSSQTDGGVSNRARSDNRDPAGGNSAVTSAQDAKSADEVEQHTQTHGRKQEMNSRPKAEKAARTVRILGFRELNSRRADVALVRPSVEHHLRYPNTLNWEQFLCLGMVSSRHCDIHLVTRVLEAALFYVRANVDVKFMTNMVGAAAKSRRWLMAVQLLHVMRSNGIDPNEITYTVILAEISRAKQHHIAKEMMETEALGSELFAYNALISGCTASRGYDRALGYLEEMLAAKVKPNAMTFSSLIASARNGSEQSVKRAFETLDRMKNIGVRPDTYCMNCVMSVSVDARQPNTALDVFREMERDGIPRDVISYNTAIKACDKLRDANAALRLLEEAKQASLLPDTFTYNSVISACGHSSLWEEALQLFEEMHETGVEAGLMTHNTVIAACVRAQNPDKAMEVFAMIRERGLKPDQYSFAGAFHACLQLKDMERSIELLTEMERMRMPANALSYATVIRTCARCGDSKRAVEIYGRSLGISAVPIRVTFTCLLEAFEETKDAERAAWVLSEMVDYNVPIDEESLQLAMKACTVQADVALRVLEINEQLGFPASQWLHDAALEVN